MKATLEYIESYFQHTLNPEERKSFEQKCEQDQEFAQDVAFYLTTRQVLREELLEQKQAQWREEKDTLEELPSIAPAKRSVLRSWVAYAAAACLVLAASVYLFETTSSPQKLASTYVDKNYSQLSIEMGGDLKDSIQRGIAAYNNKEYDSALEMFKGVEQGNPEKSYAKQYTGLVYLQMKDYDNALAHFDALSKMPGLQSNPGDFLKAVTLLERNRTGDKEEAKTLLQKVIDEKEEGSKEAEEWIKKF